MTKENLLACLSAYTYSVYKRERRDTRSNCRRDIRNGWSLAGSFDRNSIDTLRIKEGPAAKTRVNRQLSLNGPGRWEGAKHWEISDFAESEKKKKKKKGRTKETSPSLTHFGWQEN